MQAVEQVGHILEPAQRGMAEYLAVDKLTRNHHLRTVGGDKVHFAAHGGEQLLQRVEAPARGRHKADARGFQSLDKIERLRRHIAFAVQKRAVHVRCDELDHAASFSMAPHAPRACSVSFASPPLYGAFRKRKYRPRNLRRMLTCR